MICEALSDRMPAVARGDASWDNEEAAHLGICRDCQLEWRLVAPIALAARPAPTMDIERIAAAVHAAVRPTPTVVSITSRRRWSRALVGLAAAAGKHQGGRLAAPPLGQDRREVDGVGHRLAGDPLHLAQVAVEGR